jgi:hypothetical protein
VAAEIAMHVIIDHCTDMIYLLAGFGNTDRRNQHIRGRRSP